MAATVDIKLKRPSKIYHEGVGIPFVNVPTDVPLVNQQESVTGIIIFECKTESRHEGITITLDGSVNMQLSTRNVGIFEGNMSIRV